MGAAAPARHVLERIGDRAALPETLRHGDAARTRRRRSVRLYLLRNPVHMESQAVMMTIDLVLLIVALVCFLAAAANIPSSRVNRIAAGLALWVLSLLI